MPTTKTTCSPSGTLGTDELVAISSLPTDRKYLLLEAIARKMRTGDTLKSALRAIDPEAEYPLVKIECLVFPYEKDTALLLGLLLTLILSKSV